MKPISTRDLIIGLLVTIAALIIAGLTACAPQPEHPAACLPIQHTRYCLTNNTELKLHPYPGADAIDQLEQGQEVFPLLGQMSAWLEIELEKDGSLLTGYVSRRNVDQCNK